MAHILWFSNVLRDAQDYAIVHHLRGILLHMILSSHHLLRSRLLRLPESIIGDLLVNRCNIVGRTKHL